jgi:hypothetical protein
MYLHIRIFSLRSFLTFLLRKKVCQFAELFTFGIEVKTTEANCIAIHRPTNCWEELGCLLFLFSFGLPKFLELRTVSFLVNFVNHLKLSALYIKTTIWRTSGFIQNWLCPKNKIVRLTLILSLSCIILYTVYFTP